MSCCLMLENHIGFAGERGIGVLVQMVSDNVMFSLQSRGIAHADEVNIRPAAIELVINVASEVAIQYCPWCGQLLEDLAASAPARFAELAKKHERLRAVPT